MIFSVFFFSWLIANFKNILLFVYFWQLKEYRLDLLRAHLQTRQGKKGFFNWFFVLKIVLLFLILFSRGIVLLITSIIFMGEALWALKAFLTRRLIKPIFTAKALLIIIGTLFLQGLFLVYRLPFVSPYQAFLEANLLLLFFIGLIVAVLSLPSWFFKREIIKKAKKKIRNYPDLKVIGITGSFGKTSTKEFLAQILRSRFKVLATREHNNTDIGVARQILKELEDHHEVYIVEMGAYKKREIKSICDLVSPQIGIITGLGTQHLSLFGSLKNLIQAKFELIESLPPKGLAVFNGDNQPSQKLVEKTGLKKMIYSTQNAGVDFYAQSIKVLKERIRFEVKKDQQSQVFEAQLLGKQNISNLLAAITVAFSLGLSLREMAKAVTKIKPLSGTMKLFIGAKGLFLVDDSYNSNPEGVLAALEYLRIFPKAKFLIFQPMIELGKEVYQEHQRVLKKALKVCSLIFLTNKNFYPQIIGEFSQGDKERIILATSFKRLVKRLATEFKKGDAILFEGKETEKYLKLLRPIENV